MDPKQENIKKKHTNVYRSKTAKKKMYKQEKWHKREEAKNGVSLRTSGENRALLISAW